jgi:hypothetical protein
MTIRFSSGLRNFLNEGGSLKQAFAGGKLQIRSGAQPSSANDAAAGTLLATITLSSGAHTAEVSSVGSVDLTGGASGSVDTLTVNSIEIMGSATPFNTSLAQTAADVVEKINNNPLNMLFKASVTATDVITITAKPGLGTLPNGWVVASTVTTITKTDSNMAGGVASVNGLRFGDSVAGVLSKLATDVWSGLGLSDGTAGHFRFLGSVADAGSSDSSEVFHRIDGNIATSGADLNMTNTNIVTSATQTISTATITVPASV